MAEASQAIEAATRAAEAAPRGAWAYISRGLPFLGVAIDYVGRVRAGEDKLTATAKAIGSEALFSLMPQLFWASAAYSLAGAAGKIAINQIQNRFAWKNRMTLPFQQTFRDSQQALTMRQAAVQAIAGSRLNARSALGQEGKLMQRLY